jgi:hypothetical protein
MCRQDFGSLSSMIDLIVPSDCRTGAGQTGKLRRMGARVNSMVPGRSHQPPVL